MFRQAGTCSRTSSNQRVIEPGQFRATYLALLWGSLYVVLERAAVLVDPLGHRLVQGNNVYVSVHPTSREEADRIFEALTEDGEVEMPIGDQAWGDYYGALKDRFGVQWMVNYSPPREE
jgi:hypothetical protein